MKRIVYIVAGLVVGCLIGRLTVKPEVRTEVVTEYRPILTSITAPTSISEPIGSRIERVKLIYLREDNRDTLSNGSSDGLSNQPVTDSNTFVTAELPIRDYAFSDDSTYTITARGVYVESLPRVEFYPRTTKTRTEQVVRIPRITHGFQVGGGVAYTPQGFQPAVYIGYGLAIRF